MEEWKIPSNEHIVKEDGKKPVKVIFEDLSDSETFGNPNDGYITWGELKRHFLEKLMPIIRENTYRRIEVGSIGWFYLRNKTKGRFLPLGTMHMARFLKK